MIDTSSLLIANNTGLVHVASALNTPLVVMYARTNMEHAPWMAHGKVIYFDPDKKSKTPILYFSAPKERIVMPDEHDIVNAVLKLTQGEDEYIQRYLVA